MLINLSTIPSNILLSHIHILSGIAVAVIVLQSFSHDLIHISAAFNIELMQEVVLVEIHHFLKDLSLIQLLVVF